jgi:hypothetical protein
LKRSLAKNKQNENLTEEDVESFDSAKLSKGKYIEKETDQKY